MRKNLLFVYTYLPHFFILIIIVLFVSATLLKILTPKQALPTPVMVQENYQTSSSNKSVFKGIRFIGNKNFSIPERIGIYSAKVDNNSFESLKNSLINSYQMKQNKYSDSIWNGQTHTISTDIQKNQLRLEKNSPSIKKESRKLNEETAIISAREFVNKYFSSSIFIEIKTNIEYFLNSNQMQETTKSSAEIIRIPFSYVLDGIPVFFDKSTGFPILITVHQDYEITKATLTPYLVSFEKIGEQPTISIEQAIGVISSNSDRAAIIFADTTDLSNFSISELSSVIFSDVKLEYRIDDQQKIVYPYYRFSGRATNEKEVEMEIIVITPAFETKTN